MVQSFRFLSLAGAGAVPTHAGPRFPKNSHNWIENYMDTQTCTQCLTPKPLSGFYYSNNNILGYATICLECVANGYQKNKSIFDNLKLSLATKIIEVKKTTKEKNKEIAIHSRKKEQERRMEWAHARVVEQRTKYRGSVYLLISENGLYKIGRSNNVSNRLNMLNRDIPTRVSLIYSILSENTIRAEKLLHKKFAKERVKYEWFQLSQEQVSWICSLRDFDIDKLLPESPI